MNAIIENMITRRSVRKFKSDAIPTELLEQVVEAGRFAASGHNRQPWLFIVVNNPDIRHRLSKSNASFFDMEVDDPFYGAPTIIIVLTRKTTPTYLYDGSLAMGNLMLAAHSLGLATCWIHRAKQEFETAEWQTWLHSLGVENPQDYEGIGHCAIGYAANSLPPARPRKEDNIIWVE